MANANTATPTISRFTQTNTIQRCKFELTVSDGDLLSRPDTVDLHICLRNEPGCSVIVTANRDDLAPLTLGREQLCDSEAIVHNLDPLKN